LPVVGGSSGGRGTVGIAVITGMAGEATVAAVVTMGVAWEAMEVAAEATNVVWEVVVMVAMTATAGSWSRQLQLHMFDCNCC
jgi:hypothetical protein